MRTQRQSYSWFFGYGLYKLLIFEISISETFYKNVLAYLGEDVLRDKRGDDTQATGPIHQMLLSREKTALKWAGLGLNPIYCHLAM